MKVLHYDHYLFLKLMQSFALKKYSFLSFKNLIVYTESYTNFIHNLSSGKTNIQYTDINYYNTNIKCRYKRDCQIIPWYVYIHDKNNSVNE